MLAELIAELPDGVVVTDPDIVASYRQDPRRRPHCGHRDTPAMTGWFGKLH
jgi:glycolate oxidase